MVILRPAVSWWTYVCWHAPLSYSHMLRSYRGSKAPTLAQVKQDS
jgi:hypothetical protein